MNTDKKELDLRYNPTKAVFGTINNQPPISEPGITVGYSGVPDVEPTNLGTISVYPTCMYTYKVIPTPEEIEINGVKVLRYYLFAETFIKSRIKDMETKKTSQVILVPRSLKSTATFVLEDQNKYSIDSFDGYFKQVFTWDIRWRPLGVSKIKAVHPYGIDDLPFTTLETDLDLSLMADTDILKIPFLMREGSENKPVVLRTTLPIFDLYLE